MVFKDEVCIWFKNSESPNRLELICGLLNMCVPLELRFIRTCVDDLGKRDDMLRDYDSKANSSQEFSQLGEILDDRTRSKLIVYVALLEANNQTCSKLIFEKLTNSQEASPIAFSENKSNVNHVKEMLLIYTMVLHHPAFTFEEKRVIGEKFKVLENQLPCTWAPNATSHFSIQHCTQEGLSNLETCHDLSSSQVCEACDSGLSIGTEPEVELLSDHACGPVGIQASQSSRIPSIENTAFGNYFGSLGEHENGIGPSKNHSKHIPSIPRCAGNQNAPISQPQPSVNATVTSAPVNVACVSDPMYREASSSGSGESLDMYGESVTVPTTYIYNSSIYDHQNIAGMPAMSLGNNIMDMTPGYMCHQNGNCHFYRYPLVSNSISSVSIPRKPHSVTPLESSSSEEGRKALVTSKQQRVSLNSPSSSPQSSPYASPPQSLSPSRAASPPENNFCSNFQSSNGSCVTGTTTSVVITKASPRPPSRHCSSSSSGNGSNPSSPALASSSQSYRNKPTVTSKISRYPNNRCNARRGSQLNAQENVSNQQLLDSHVALTKVNSVGSCSKNQLTEEECKNKNTPDISLSMAAKICDRTVPSSSSNTLIPISDPAFVVTSTGCSGKNLFETVVSSNELSKRGAVESNSDNTAVREFLSDNDDTATVSDNKEKRLLSINGQTNECHSNASVKNTAVNKLPSNLTCGFNGFVNPSSSHSVPVMTSVPSGTCSHMHSPRSISHHNEDPITFDSLSQVQEVSLQGTVLGDNVDVNLECEVQLSKTSFKESEDANVDSSLAIPLSSCAVVALSSHSTSNLTTGKSFIASSNVTTSVNQNTSKSPPKQLKEQTSSLGSSQSPASVGNKSSGNTSVYATTTSNSTASMVPIVPSNGTYPPFFPFPMMPGGNTPYLIQGGFPHPHGHVRAPSQPYFMASPSSILHGHPNHYMKGGRNHHMLPPPSNFNGANVKSRGNGCGRSGSSSSSSSSMGRKKMLSRGVTFPNKSLSSDSSPSSSQYSSPPQTPSPDHTKDVRRKAGKTEPYPLEDVWEQTDSKGPCVSNVPHDDAPILPPMSSHMIMPSNPIRQRYFQFPHPLGYIGYPPPSHGMFRYAPVAIGPRPPTPLNSEKPNRETTPPSHPLIGGTEMTHKSIEYSNPAVPTSIPYNCNIAISSHSSGSSSSSPPVVPIPDSSNVALVPPPGSSAVHACSQNGSMQYNPPSYQMFAMNPGQYVGHLPGLFSPPNTSLPNNFVSPHSLPPNFPPMGNIMNSELMYPGQYPILGQTAPSISSCGGHNVMHHSNGPVYTPLYHTPPPATVPIPPPTKKPHPTCYNCGRGGHRGSECKEASMDDLTKHTKLL